MKAEIIALLKQTKDKHKMNTFKTRSQARQFTSKANALIGESLYKASSVKGEKGWGVSFKGGILSRNSSK
jgi:GR25 family glycosyltransferase involved in LPS biosynthesis